MLYGNFNNSPIRSVKGKVELYEGSTLLNTFTYRDNLTSFEVERQGASGKFFGFGICQKITIKLVDKDRQILINKNQYFKAFLTTDEGEEAIYRKAFPEFYVDEVKRDENTNALTIVAYDLLHSASTTPYELTVYKEAIEEGLVLALSDYVGIGALALGLPWYSMELMGVTIPTLPVSYENIPSEEYGLAYPEGTVNLEGTENIREVLDALAEALQCIYYITTDLRLKFKRLDRDGEAVLTIDKSIYFTLKSEDAYTLNGVIKTTELGDNVGEPLDFEGVQQHIHENPFFDKRDDVEVLVDKANSAISGISITPFDCSWRGNYLLELGDKIKLVTKDNSEITSYLLSDKLTYNGALAQASSWKYEETTSAVSSNPTTLGESLKQTFAKVDKANKQITTLVSDVSANKSTLTQIQSTVDGINTTVESIEKTTGTLGEDIETLTKTVETKMTDEEVSIKISSALENGVTKVDTGTGFLFNEDGLTVSKTESEVSTIITENGMEIFETANSNNKLLTANKDGVNAKNLHATTYLIIGENSRFEDYNNKKRTGCFWIGGNS